MDILETVGILDLIFIVILAISVLLGLIRGMIREVLSLVGLAASIYLAFTFADSLSKNYVSQFLENPRISYIVTFVLIIVATLFFVTLINLLFSQLLKASGLSFLNRFFGALFGLLRGGIICSLLVMVIGFVPGIASKPWWQASTLAPIFTNLTKTTFKYLPQEISDYFESAKDSVGNAASQMIPTPAGGAQAPANSAAPTNRTAAPQLRPNSSSTINPSAAVDEQTRLVLQSIEDSRQDSSNDAVTPPSANSSNDAAHKPQLILESYQETN